MPPVLQVGDGDVEADVDHRWAALDLLVVLLERLRRTCRPASGCRSRSAWSCRRRPPRSVPDVKSSHVVVPPKNISMCVCGSIAPGITIFPDASITLSAVTSSDSPISVIDAVLDVDVADVVVGGRDDAPSLDEHGHAASPFLFEFCPVYTRFRATASTASGGLLSCQSVTRWNACAARSTVASSNRRPTSARPTGGRRRTRTGRSRRAGRRASTAS